MQIGKPISQQPLPKRARRVFKGEIFDVFQWNENGYDGLKLKFEKVKRPDTVVVIPVTKTRKIILCRQQQPGKKPYISLPAGRVDKGESVFAAAKRELIEETGHKAGSWILYNALQPVSKVEWSVYTFIARKCQQVSNQKLDSGEKIKIFLVDFNKFVKIASSVDFGDLELRVKLLEAKLKKNGLKQLKKLMGL